MQYNRMYAMETVNKSGMLALQRLLAADYVAKKVSDIDFEHLREKGIKAVAIDADRTLLPFLGIKINEAILDHLLAAQDAGYIEQIVIASNRRRKNLNDAAKSLDTVVVQANNIFDAKPFAKYYKRLFKQINYEPHETIMIGDKLFTDIVGGNLYGMPTLRVNKIR